ncbi:methyltransferase family protein [Oleiharenicola sp. Vm1]|uniref:methyltransferase family protein n=1 Tax=Oleiharenicola sp. Vm1 TaxID=3398393 RepID=UPI0039F550EF
MILLARSVLFAFLVPVLLVGWIPLVMFERHPEWSQGGLAPHEWLAVLLAAAGLAGYLHCAWQFTRKGRGTVAPWDGPRRLVQRGLYRWVRNPMYLSLGLVVLAEVLYFESWRIGLYLLCLACVAQLLVVLHEEPELGFRFGAMYEDYKRAVPRWFPRRPKPAAFELDPSSVER